MDSLIAFNIRKLLLNHNLEVASEDPWEDLVCNLCGKLSMNAYQTFCGCTFCRHCIYRRLQGIDEMCPGGKADCQIEGLVFDRNVTRNGNLILRVSRLKVVCPHESCRVVVEVSQMMAHMDVCPERPIDCPFAVLGCTSGGRVSSWRMKTHILEEAVTHSQMMMARFGEIHKYTNEDPKEIIKRAEEQKNNRIYERREMNEDNIHLADGDSVLQSRMEEAIKALTGRMDADRNESRKMMEAVISKIDEEGKGTKKIKNEVKILKKNAEINGKESKIMKTEMEAVKRKIEEEGKEAKKTKEEIPRLQNEIQTMKAETARYREDTNQKLETMETQTVKGIVEDVASTVTNVQEERRRVDQLREIVDGLNIGTNKVVAVGRLSFKVDKFTSRMNDGDFVHSPYFYTHSNGYKLRLTVYPGGFNEERGSHMSVLISICKGEYDDVLSWPCKNLITVAVINERTNEAHLTYTISYCSIFKDNFIKPNKGDNPACGPTSYIPHEDLLSIEGLMVDESVFLQIAVSPPQVYIASFKIDKFKQKMAANEIIYSSYFYTHSNGYKLRLDVHPGGNGKGRGSHMSLGISICKGVYDDVLSWPCKYLITVAVVNQRTNEAHATHTISYCSRFKEYFIKPTQGDNQAIGTVLFISHKDLLTIEGILVDESVLLKIAFTPPSL